MSTKYLPITLLIILGITTRFLPHTANFTAIGAIAFFSGRYLPKKYAWLLPMSAMFVSDIFIGFYSLPIMISVYMSFALMVYLGQMTKNGNTINIISNTIAGSLLFYAFTNWAVWAFGTMYPHSFVGLMESYYMAIPFFKNTIAADLIYTTLLVGGYELMPRLIKNNETKVRV